jgi:hypothetical protein
MEDTPGRTDLATGLEEPQKAQDTKTIISSPPRIQIPSISLLPTGNQPAEILEADDETESRKLIQLEVTEANGNRVNAKIVPGVGSDAEKNAVSGGSGDKRTILNPETAATTKVFIQTNSEKVSVPLPFIKSPPSIEVTKEPEIKSYKADLYLKNEKKNQLGLLINIDPLRAADISIDPKANTQEEDTMVQLAQLQQEIKTLSI